MTNETIRTIILAYKHGLQAYADRVPSARRIYVSDESQFAYDLGYQDAHRAHMDQEWISEWKKLAKI